ncbi:nuclear transport factor 2 family protein [Pseudonocardia sp. RS11V-5]|uniref:nuclear transport factor 2 family protein n=1 Tax=Pseudonocardia terrae TaxID=2905831 RepID=UPI001E54729B|nr:nuclear transport factor 2 family protein [Pseudonocardia terrae]MCE3551442.1 nuclear transport factor 2 family protein [Pseudonocardia terrae]
MSDADNLVEAFAAADKGDPTLLVNLYADDMTWAGFKADGTQTVYTKASFLEGFGILAHLDEAKNEVVRTETTPEGVVIAWVRALRRKGDDVLDFTLIMVHQFVDGKVTRGADVAPPSFGEYWTKLGLA